MKVGIIMGSKSDLDTMKKASAILDEFNIPYEMVIASAHRTPEAVKSFVERLEAEQSYRFYRRCRRCSPSTWSGGKFYNRTSYRYSS